MIRFLIFIILCIAAGTFAQTPDVHEEALPVVKPIRTERNDALFERKISPDEYVIGAGDELTLSIFSGKYFDFDLIVSPEGIITIPQVGSLDVADLTLAQANTKAVALVGTVFRSARAHLGLARARMIKVNVTGEVKTPQVITLSALERLSDAISASGGVTTKGSLRNIRIEGRRRATADIARFNATGDVTSNPMLSGGEIIIVPPRVLTVEVSGEVNAPNLFDFTPGDDMERALTFAGMFTDLAAKDSVELVRFGADHVSTITSFIDCSSATPKIMLEPFDRIYVRRQSNYYIMRDVTIEGEVRKPGKYAIGKETISLEKLLSMAGGVTDEASLKEARIFRKVRTRDHNDQELDRLTKSQASVLSYEEYDYLKARLRDATGKLSLDFTNPVDRGKVLLHEDDSVFIPRAQGLVRVTGRVARPGGIRYEPSLSYKEYIERAGGFGYRASKGDVLIYKASSDEPVEASTSMSVEAGDIIYVPESEQIKFSQTITTIATILGPLAAIISLIIIARK